MTVTMAKSWREWKRFSSGDISSRPTSLARTSSVGCCKASPTRWYTPRFLRTKLAQADFSVKTANFEFTDSPDPTPSRLAAFYRSVNGDYDILLTNPPPPLPSPSVLPTGRILQPTPSDKGFTELSIPALKAKGFVTWQTIQILGAGITRPAEYCQRWNIQVRNIVR